MAKERIEKELVYTKKQLIKSKKYEEQKDLLNALLKENERYTITNVDEIIKKFTEGVNG